MTRSPFPTDQRIALIGDPRVRAVPAVHGPVPENGPDVRVRL
ncbi:hypothetical protein [Streptomyces sp. NPDC056669]